MGNGDRPRPVLRFGTFELDLQEQQLRRGGRRVRLQHKPFQLLAILVERPSILITREELRERLWPDTHVDFEHGLNTAINKLRAALQDQAENPRFVETIPRRGYRFIAPVQVVDEGAEPPAGSPAPQPSRLIGMASLAAVLLAIVAGLATWRSRESVSVDRRLMLAVLPFEDANPDPQQEYFSAGLTEEMILHLARLDPQRLGVIARTSVMRYKGTETTIDRIARELRVDYVLEGSVQRSGNLLRIRAKLVGGDDQSTIWANSYEREVDDWFALQRDLAEQIAKTLGLRVLPAAEDSVPRARAGSEAREAYLKGRYFRNQITETSFHRAMEYFGQATRLEPDFADAYSGMASCYCLLAGHGFEVAKPSDAMVDARKAALKALSLDASLAESHAVLGMVKLKYDWDFEGSERSLHRALELDPSYAQAHVWHSLLLEVTGRQHEAVEAAKRAHDLDPLSLGVNANLGNQLLQGGDVPGAQARFRSLLELDPQFWGAQWGLGRCMLSLERYDDAIPHLERAVEFGAGNTVSSTTLAYAYALAGRSAEAQDILQQLEGLSRQRYVSPALVAYVHVGLGDRDAAFRQLEQAYGLRSRYLVWLAVAPEYRELHGDPRFQDLLRRLGLDRFGSAG